jgi:hypothetical protein
MKSQDLRAVLRHASVHPKDAVLLARSGWALRRREWWRHAPFLPLASDAYWEFRMLTATGQRDESPRIDDLVAAAKWSLRQRPGR